MELQVRKNILLILIILSPIFLFSQNKEGIIHYTAYMEYNWQEFFEDEPEMQQYASTFPDTVKHFFTFFFTEKKSLFQRIDTVIEENIMLDDYGINDSPNYYYTDLEKRILIESRDVWGQNFLIIDSLDKLNPTITILPEKEEIEGYSCMKAIFKIQENVYEVCPLFNFYRYF